MPVTFENLMIGSEYTRPQLAKIWRYAGYEALSRGVITPADSPYIILFITKEKQAFLTQYEDVFRDGILEIEGETGHMSDQRIVGARSMGDEIHLFFRERHHTPFTYEGPIFLTDHQLHADRPSRFRFAIDAATAAADSGIETEEITHGIVDPEFIPDEEGRRKIIQHVSYERSRKNRAKAIEIHGTRCLVCGFDFNEVYGADFARDYIEIHHVTSITEQEGRPIDPATDFIPLCSNCHSMVHRRRGFIFTPGDLRKLLKIQAKV